MTIFGHHSDEEVFAEMVKVAKMKEAIREEQALELAQELSRGSNIISGRVLVALWLAGVWSTPDFICKAKVVICKLDEIRKGANDGNGNGDKGNQTGSDAPA